MTKEQIEPIRTARLLLRPVVEADAPDFVDLFTDPDVVRYLYNDVIPAAEIPAYMTRYINGVVPGDQEWLTLAVEFEGEFMGLASVCYRSVEHRQAELGYIFKASGEGQGFATEAARRMLAWCFEELDVHRVVGRIEVRNIKSERVLQRLGMRKEAHLTQNEWVKGEWNDEVIYAITQPEWRASLSS